MLCFHAAQTGKHFLGSKLDQFAHATKMAAEDRATAACIVIALLMEEDDERRTRVPDRDWIKRRREKGAFQNIVKELVAEDLPFFLHTGQLRFQFLHLSKIFRVLLFSSTSCCVDKSGGIFSAILPDQQGILLTLEVNK